MESSPLASFRLLPRHPVQKDQTCLLQEGLSTLSHTVGSASIPNGVSIGIVTATETSGSETQSIYVAFLPIGIG